MPITAPAIRARITTPKTTHPRMIQGLVVSIPESYATKLLPLISIPDISKSSLALMLVIPEPLIMGQPLISIPLELILPIPAAPAMPTVPVMVVLMFP
jgi:hypothetical protein